MMKHLRLDHVGRLQASNGRPDARFSCLSWWFLIALGMTALVVAALMLATPAMGQAVESTAREGVGESASGGVSHGVSMGAAEAVQTVPMWLQVIKDSAVLTLFVIVGVGMLVGRIKVAGLSLGSSAVLFAALLAGHLGMTVSGDVGQMGLVLFVYGVGLGAGPSFFRAFVRQGKKLAQLSLVVVFSGALAAAVFAWISDVPSDLAVGIFAGALTSTPALAAAVEQLGEQSNVSIGYGVSYPVGVVAVVLFVQLFPKLIGKPVETLTDETLSTGESFKRLLVEVTNPAVLGKAISELSFINSSNCAPTRVLDGTRLVPITADAVLEKGQCLWLVGDGDAVKSAGDYLGRPAEREYVMDTDRERRRVVVTSSGFTGKTLEEVEPLQSYGVIVARVKRQDVAFAPSQQTQLRPGDVLTIVGAPEHLERFAVAAGHREKALDETDLMSLAFGLSLGVLVGMLSLNLKGAAISLGLAGGPLLVALVLGHFGRFAGLVGYVPRAARMFLTELGLVFFLAWAGARAGGSFVQVIQSQGVMLVVMSVVVAVLPLLIGYLFARKILKLSVLQTLGGMCGGMTSTPGLGAITAKTDVESPVISYAAAYPVALILMTVAAKLIISAFGGG